MLKKVFLITQHYPYGNGERTFVEPEMKVLLDSGQFDITIICNSAVQNNVSPKVDPRIEIVNIPLQTIYKKPLCALKAFCKFWTNKVGNEEWKELKKNNQNFIKKVFDSLYFYIQAEIFYKEICKRQINMDDSIIYTYWFNTQALTISLYKDRWKNIHFVSRIHGFDLYDERTLGGRQPFRSLMDEKVDVLYFIAESGLEYYKTHFHISSVDKYVVSRLGTLCLQDYNDIVCQQEKRNIFTIVSCSSLIPLKRVNYIVQALSMISEIEIEWIHFGDGIEKNRLEQQAEQLLGTKENIHFDFKGATDNRKIQSFYLNNKVDCFITTSRTEGCPVSIQEALSYGIPIIATAVGEIPLMVQGNGILLDQHMKISEIVDAIREMYDLTYEEKEQMRKISRNLWEQYFDANRNYNVFAESLLEI